MTAIKRCEVEQGECGDYIRSGNPDQRGAQAGAADWIAEETLIRRECDDFLERKSQLGGMSGFELVWMPDFLFDFQAFLVDWHCRKGRSAGLLDCGMGKTPIQLVWAENVKRHENKPVLILTPLGVSAQTIREGEKFGIEVERSRDGKFKSELGAQDHCRGFEPL